MLATELIEQVRRDLATFVDPGTTVDLLDATLIWTRGRVQRTAQLIRRAEGFPDVLYGGKEYAYLGFLASEALADLHDLAQSIVSQLQIPEQFIEAPALDNAEGNSIHSASKATDLILSRTVDRQTLPLAATRVLFVHGNAGTGKTSALTYVARKQAERYLTGETTTLFLYLDAQGKGLAQLEDVMARALQDLRAHFTYHSVAALTRRHCLIPIVDGFDELIGPSSAREALSNLTQFLAQLDCAGAVVASSRSAFIDYKTLHERAAEIAAAQNLSYEIYPVEVIAWPESAVIEYCRRRNPASGELARRISRVMESRSGELVRKPFFLSKVCSIVEDGGDVDTEEDLTHQIVDAALARETEKLRDSRGKPLLTKDQHRQFCELLADEMWAQGRPELDSDSIRLLAELHAEALKLDPKDRKTLIDRSIAHGLLVQSSAGGADKRVFEHELFRFEFQAGSLAKSLAAGEAGDHVLRAELPLEVVSRLPSYGPWSNGSIREALDRMARLIHASPNNQYVAANAGSIGAALARDRRDLPRGLVFDSFYVRAFDLAACRLQGARLLNCVLERVSLFHTQLIECEIQNTQFIACVVGPETRFDGSGVEVASFFGIVLHAPGREPTEEYDPSKIASWLRDHGAALPERIAEIPHDSTALERIEMVERLLKHARTHYYLSRNDRWFQNNLGNHRQWPAVEDMLRRFRLIEDARLAKSGRPEVFIKLTVAPDVVLRARAGGAQADLPITAFWRALEEGRA